MNKFSKILIYSKKLFLNNYTLIFIILIGAFLRFYKINEYMFFAGDQGRDILSASHLLLYGKIPLSGPLGSGIPLLSPPTYYYIITLLFALSGMKILLLQYLIIILGIASILLVYLVTRELSSKKSALFATLLYSFSSLMILYSRSITQPFITPFFLLLFLLFLLKAFKQKKYKYFLISLPLFIIWVQLYYASLILVPVLLFWIFYIGHKIKPQKKFFLYNFMILFFLSCFFYFPFIKYEIINNFPNIKTLINFVVGSGSVSNKTSLLLNLKKSLFYLFLILRYDSEKVNLSKTPFTLLLFISLIILNFKTIAKRKIKFNLIFISSIIISGFILFNFYLISGRFNAPFLIPLYPFLIISMGILISNIDINIEKINKYLKITALIVGIVLLFYNGYREMLNNPRKNEYQKTKIATDFIVSKAKEERLNNFDLFVIDDVDQWNWDAPPFWLLIEKELKKQFTTFMPEQNKLRLTRRPPDTLFLICKNTNGGLIPKNCPEEFFQQPFYSDFNIFSSFIVKDYFSMTNIKIYELGDIKWDF